MIRGLRFFLAMMFSVGVAGSTIGQNRVIEQIPFRLNDGHVIIELSLDNSAPLNFIFDSGAGASLISNKTADSLGYDGGAKRKNVGVSGEHKVNLIKWVKISHAQTELTIASLLSTETYFEELDNGASIHGVIGYDLLNKYVIELDYDEQLLTFYNSSSYRYEGSGERLPIYVVQNLPIADARVIAYNGVSFEGQFMVDTGARSDVIISSPSVIKYDLAENIGSYYSLRASVGTSTRRTKMRYGRLASFAFANKEFKDIPVALSSDNKGVLSMDFIDGIIGARLLKRFKLIFDYERSKLYLEPGSAIDDSYVINLTGFTLSFQDAQPVIKNLIDRSPADKAGLRNGDQIVSINTVLVENMSPEEIRKAFENTGETLALVIRRSDKLKYTEFKPKPLL